MQVKFELPENLFRKSQFAEVCKTKAKHNKSGHVYQCSAVPQGGKDPDTVQVLFSCGSYLFSVSFMMMFPREEKTMKDIRSMGLQTHRCFTLTRISKQNIHILERLILLLPDKFLCQLLHKGVNLYPVILHTSRSEKNNKNMTF